MPFTPFHLGPGCAVKVLASGRFSLTVFGFANVAMDVESLVYLLRGEGVRHGAGHTLLGATLIGGISALAGRPLCQRLLDLWVPAPRDHFLCWLRGPRVLTWRSAVVAAFLGTYSHVLLDSMIHADVRPFAPFDERNPLLGLVPFGAMHLLCVGVGVLGLLGLVVRYQVEGKQG
jgi:hypothetical protein